MPVVPITEANDLPSSFDKRPRQEEVLMITPIGYEVGEHINSHMHGTANKIAALQQWETLRDAYDTHTTTHVIDAAAYASADSSLQPLDNLPDMVFAANQTLVNTEQNTVVLANMATEQRHGEVPYFRRFFEERGWTISTIPPHLNFEGSGDAIWHPNKDLLWGGYGIRTDEEAYEHVADVLDTTIYTIELTDETYYHLDTCYMPLDEDTVLIAEDGFGEDVQDAIHRLWDTVLIAPKYEASDEISCNVHPVTDNHVFMSTGAPETEQLLEGAGYTVHTFDLSEFKKAGGSVACLHQKL